MSPALRSLWSLHAAVLLLGGTALFSQLIPLSSVDITFWRSLVAFMVLLAMVKLARSPLRLFRPRDYAIALFLGLIMAAHWVSYFAAMQYASVSVGIIALFTFPVITVFLEPLFERVRLALSDVISALAVLVGIALIVPEASLGNDITLGISVGVLSAFLYAVRNLVLRKYFSQYSGAQAMTYQTLVIVLSLLVFIDASPSDISVNAWALLILLGSVFTALPHALIANSLRHLRAKTFSLVACAQPLYAAVLAMWLLDERPTMGTFIGGALVVCAAVYETVATHRKQGASC